MFSLEARLGLRLFLLLLHKHVRSNISLMSYDIMAPALPVSLWCWCWSYFVLRSHGATK
jgi:hypothetical protein